VRERLLRQALRRRPQQLVARAKADDVEEAVADMGADIFLEFLMVCC
jgi:hypothetical protein